MDGRVFGARKIPACVAQPLVVKKINKKSKVSSGRVGPPVSKLDNGAGII